MSEDLKLPAALRRDPSRPYDETVTRNILAKMIAKDRVLPQLPEGLRWAKTQAEEDGFSVAAGVVPLRWKNDPGIIRHMSSNGSSNSIAAEFTENKDDDKTKKKSNKIHLYWNYTKPSDLEKVSIGMGLCGESYDKSSLTLNPKKVTCSICKERHANKGETNMSDATTSAAVEKKWTGPELVKAYNDLATSKGVKTVKKFKTLAVGIKRLQSLKNSTDAGGIKKASPKKSSNKASGVKKGRFDGSETISILDKDAYNEGKKTDCGERFKKMVQSKPKTIQEFLDKRMGSIGDLKWWRDKGFIEVKR